jgi:type II secretory pathway component PulF
MIFAVPRAEAIFTDFGVPVPEITMGVIQASHWPGALVSLTVLLLIADPFARDELLRRGDLVKVRFWSALLIATPLLLLGTTLWALILPMLNVTTHISG